MERRAASAAGATARSARCGRNPSAARAPARGLLTVDVLRSSDRPDGPNLFRHEGDYWTVAFDGRTVRVRDLKGMRHLSRLLVEPGREFHVLDLVAMEAGGAGSSLALGDAGEVLDAQAKHACRRRLAEIDEGLDEADALGDAARVAQRPSSATSCCGSWRARSARVAATAVPRPRPSAPGAV